MEKLTNFTKPQRAKMRFEYYLGYGQGRNILEPVQLRKLCVVVVVFTDVSK